MSFTVSDLHDMSTLMYGTFACSYQLTLNGSNNQMLCLIYITIVIANIMKMRKMFYFYISIDSRVKIGCFLNNIVVIAQEILVISQNGV